MISATTASVAGIIACLCASALSSGSETALSSLGPVRARRLVDEGGPIGRGLRLWLERPGEVLTTILVINNAVNITASALATEVAHALLDPIAGSTVVSPIAVAIGVMTLLLLTFGEILPKTFAQANAERLAPPAMRFIAPAHRILYPIVRVFVRLSELVGASRDEDTPLLHEDDIEYMVGLGEAEGALSDNQARLLQSVFDFDDYLAREVMVPLDRVVAVPDSIGHQALLEVLVTAGHSRVPVFSGEPGNVVGVCYAKDVLRHLAGGSEFALERVCRDAQFVRADEPIDALLRDMQQSRVHLAIVREPDSGDVVGIITLEDIIEELIGDVFDEHDSVAALANTAPLPRPEGLERALRASARPHYPARRPGE